MRISDWSSDVCSSDLISTVYFGPVGAAVEISRFYEPSGCYELDISKARRLMAARTEQTDKFLVGFEGGAVYTAERNGLYLVIIDETAALDMLDAEDREDRKSTRLNSSH